MNAHHDGPENTYHAHAVTKPLVTAIEELSGLLLMGDSKAVGPILRQLNTTQLTVLYHHLDKVRDETARIIIERGGTP